MEALDEQTEARVVAELNKMQGFVPNSRTFQARKLLWEKFIELGVPVSVANTLVGRMNIVVHPDAVSGAIFDKLLEYTANNIFSLWQLYKAEISEETFLECSRTYVFQPPVLMKKDPNEEGQS